MTSAPIPILILAAAVGLVIGSFLNVVIYRLPRGESLLSPGSHCPHCSVPIRAWHNIPVLGWLLVAGRCASCRVRISPRYPLVEGATALLFVALTARLGLSAELPAYLYLAAIAITLAGIDFDSQRIPDSIVLPSYLVGALLLMPAGAADANLWAAYRGLLGMAALWAIYFVLSRAFPRVLTMADAKLAGLLGLYLGFLGWSTVLIGAVGGLLIGGLAGARVIATGRQTIPWGKRRRSTPFAACMLTAAVLALFVASPLTHWSTVLFGSA